MMGWAYEKKYSVPQAEHERRPLERNTSESEATEQLQNLYKLEIIVTVHTPTEQNKEVNDLKLKRA